MTATSPQGRSLAAPLPCSENIVTIGATSYTLLYPDLLPALSVEARSDLRASIREHGVCTPIVVDENNGVLDGANRLRIAADLGLPAVPVQVLRGSPAWKRLELAYTLNTHRRHLTEKALGSIKQARVAEVQRLREAGHSLRDISDKVGVSLPQVQRDLKAAEGVSAEDTAEQDTVRQIQPAEESTPTAAPRPVVPPKVKGRDGKRYAARRTTSRKAAKPESVASGTSSIAPVSKKVKNDWPMLKNHACTARNIGDQLRKQAAVKVAKRDAAEVHLLVERLRRLADQIEKDVVAPVVTPH
jgi:ParB-like chromosome segregation protein Spo0J